MEKFKKVLNEMKGYIVTGIGYVLPVIIVGGICMAFATFLPEGELKTIFASISDFGLKKYDIFLIMFIAHTMVPKVSLAPAFFVGLYANSMELGIFGALIVGLLVGYMCRFLSNVKLKESGKALFSMVVIPIFVSIAGVFVVHYLLHAPVVYFTKSLTALLQGMAGSNAVLLGVVLGCMIGFDLGGPVNKVAGLFALSMVTEGIRWPMTLACAAYMLPSLGAGLATLLDRKKRYFDKDEQIAGKSAFIMGFLLLSEPAIPFMLADPAFMIPVNMLMSAILCGGYAFFQITSTVALGPIFSFGVTNHPFIGLLLLLACTIGLALLILLRRKTLLAKGELEIIDDEVLA
ncbi:hypothetical protein A4S06_08775 [Erysipelotrichaceae bacterium MTC7]|nr:hypothetical protein A4S06_08775 [Erysipelotrichaceae bacterium MTC7]